MKHYYVNVESRDDLTMPEEFLKLLPKKLCLFMSIQYLEGLEIVKKQLTSYGIDVEIVQTRHTRHPGQIYGCNVEKFEITGSAYLVVGDGMFHPKALVFNNDLPVFNWNPHTKQHQIYTKKDIEEVERKKKAAYATFLHAKNIGVIVTVKPGQSHIKKALSIQERYPDKDFFILCLNEVDPEKLVDFPFLEMYINTACPRIGYDDNIRFDKPVISIGDFEGFLY